MKDLLTQSHKVVCWITVALTFCLGSCKDDTIETPEQSYDPSRAVEVTDFIPKSGGANEQMVIYGNNFGSDASIVHVSIGGEEATIIGVKNDVLYCLIPRQADEGSIKIQVGEGDNLSAVATLDEKLDYIKRTLVSTLCGEVDEEGEYDVKDGTFDDCGGFFNPSWFTFDPKRPNLLYMAQDGNDGGDVRLLDLEAETVTTPITRAMGNWGRMRSINWTMDGEYMIISNDQGNENGISTSILSRTNYFQDPQILTSYKQCNGAAIHPVNGELYFNSYEKGQFYRFDMETYFDRGLGIKDYEELFKIQDNAWEFNIRIHPSGDYAYIVVINQHYILRTDYNWETKRFTSPFVVCGEARSAAWVDGAGTSARLNNPYQGVFVKNDNYVAQGKEDVYDFYFTERGNHDIRILSPEGRVTTYAGRGSENVNSDAFGYIDGGLRDEARFNRPEALAYDETNKIFYIGDCNNHVIRTIVVD
ncbi:IPT/TIG domain-containing protein [Plebeiibacterium marinum]|uniref:IPT/TIG domain-containing protein n=1 Tax=Plebeiibacterium marinum TaxID=2992111 RepID=A0AAE3MB40_9BACT|nr:IPT/TIG domain-containing protein [Plebeiobacterium marinum]MCW3804463.1 IPT/TIG domain-containing protein [Plebeiobacterium marinum]